MPCLKNHGAALALLLILVLLPVPAVMAAGPAVPDIVLRQPATIRMLPDATFHGELLGAIQQADREIVMVYYLIKLADSNKNRPTQIVEELIKAKRRGVAVSVLLEHSSHDDALDKANLQAATLLQKNGVAVTFDSPQTTTHAKLTVIDRHLCFIGSHNLSQAALAYNHELSLCIDSPELAGQLLEYMKGIK
jgi:phosphatidylserine/phosphatidylglycerophosphate/cardiolipin synthase-like enzyme